LLPGIGAQGGAPGEVAAAFSAGPASALVSASRSVIYASAGAGWRDAARAEAERLAREAWSVSLA
jgi:orotidine-5'-phosphate decarboxylase